MELDEHTERHKELHSMLDELVADMITQTRKTPSEITVLELLDWSFVQSKDTIR